MSKRTAIAASSENVQELYERLDEATLFTFKCQGINDAYDLVAAYGLSKALEILEVGR